MEIPYNQGSTWVIEQHRDFKHFNETNFLSELESLSNLNLDHIDPNSSWEIWKNKFLHIVKTHAGSKIPLIIDSNTKTINPTDIPNQFNKYFTELGGKFSSDIPPATSTPINTLTLEVLRLLSCVTTSKATGLDQISAKNCGTCNYDITYINLQPINPYLAIPVWESTPNVGGWGTTPKLKPLQNRGLCSPESLSLSSRNFSGLSCLPVTK